MKSGTISLNGNRLRVNDRSYGLTPNSTLLVIRPFKWSGILIALLISAFGFAFLDLLHLNEVTLIFGATIVCVFFGLAVAQFVIITSDIRGSEYCVATWGIYWHLKRQHQNISENSSFGGHR